MIFAQPWYFKSDVDSTLFKNISLVYFVNALGHDLIKTHSNLHIFPYIIIIFHNQYLSLHNLSLYL